MRAKIQSFRRLNQTGSVFLFNVKKYVVPGFFDHSTCNTIFFVSDLTNIAFDKARPRIGPVVYKNSNDHAYSFALKREAQKFRTLLCTHDQSTMYCPSFC